MLPTEHPWNFSKNSEKNRYTQCDVVMFTSLARTAFLLNYNPEYLPLMHEVAFKLSAKYMDLNEFTELLFLFQGRLEK